MTHSGGALTLAVLEAAIAGLPPSPPRIIVGMPDVGDNEVFELSEPHLILLGHTAFEKLKGHAKPLDRETDPFGLTFGIAVEKWGERADHFELWCAFRAATHAQQARTGGGK